jgi:hypothetical protein
MCKDNFILLIKIKMEEKRGQEIIKMQIVLCPVVSAGQIIWILSISYSFKIMGDSKLHTK